MTLLIVLVAFGFPIAIGMAWALEVTPRGIRRETAEEDEQSSATTSPDQARVETSGPSIAVLPFADMSPDKDQDYFCEGIAEEILNALVRIEGLRVASRTSAFQFKEKASDIIGTHKAYLLLSLRITISAKLFIGRSYSLVEAIHWPKHRFSDKFSQ